ncbi:unannotated protein [freshwater metagenome]|uniref:Unannotated protein n=1 Tax=freshwater metagenome TaxID=449393 RepID=A0A6J7MEP7_9ZZZZ
MGHDHFSVPFEPAACEHNALASADASELALVVYNCAYNGSCFVGDQILCRRRQPNINAAVKQALEKCCDKCCALWADVLSFATSKLRFNLWSSWHEVFGERGRCPE